MDIEPILSVLSSSESDKVPFPKVSELLDGQGAFFFQDHDTVHSRFLEKPPVSVMNMKVFGVNGSGVIVLGGDSGLLHFSEDHDRAVSKRALRKVRSLVRRQRKRHGENTPLEGMIEKGVLHVKQPF